MPLALTLILGITAASLLAGLCAFRLRRPALGLSLVGAAVAGSGFCLWGSTRSDPPSLLPLWMWLLGLLVGALAGYGLRKWSARSRE